jgi:hypothetical protein
MQRIQNIFHWTIVGSVLSHIFCCGLPTIVSAISLVSGLGIMASMPSGLVVLHEILHSYEAHLVVFSGVMIVFGWVLHEISRRIDCHDTGCGHPPCAPKKKRSTKLLMFATFLFVINLGVYMGFDHTAPVTTGHAEHAEHIQ